MLLSAVAWILLAPKVYRVGRYVFLWEKSYSLTAAICMLLSPRLLAMNLSGMETTLATLLTLIALEIHYRSREMKHIRIREAIVLFLGIAIRPEFILLAMLAIADWIFLLAKQIVNWKSVTGFIVVLLFLTYFIFTLPLHEHGSLLYHSSIVQGAGARFPAGVGALPLMARTIERGRWCSAIPLRVGFRTKPTRDVP